MYQRNIKQLRLRLPELQAYQSLACKIREQRLKEGWKNDEEILQQEGLLHMLKVIKTKLISRHYYDFLIRHFGINKTKELVNRKYYSPIIWSNVENYGKKYDVCLTLMIVK